MATRFAVTSRLMQGFRFAAPATGNEWAIVPFRDGARPSELVSSTGGKLLHWWRDPGGDGLWVAEDLAFPGTLSAASPPMAAGSSAVDLLVHYYAVDDRNQIFTRTENDATWRQILTPGSNRGAITAITGIKMGNGPGMEVEPFVVVRCTGTFGNGDDVAFLRLTDQGGWQPVAYAQSAIVDWCPAVFALPTGQPTERRGVAFLTDGTMSAAGPRTPALPDAFVGAIDGTVMLQHAASAGRLVAMAAGPSGLTHDRLFVSEQVPGRTGDIAEVGGFGPSTTLTPVSDPHALTGDMAALWLGPYEPSGLDVVHLFAIGDGLLVKHGDGHGGWGDFHEIDVPFTPQRLIGGSPFAEWLALFVLGDDGALYVVSRDPESEDWQYERVDQSSPDVEQVFPVYSVQVAAFDGDVPRPGLSVVIEASDVTEFEINGVWQAMGPTRSVSVITNAIGEVNLTIPTEYLRCTAFTIEDVVGGTTLEVEPYGSVLQFVTSRTAAQLLAAKTLDAAGSSVDLLQGADRSTQATALALGLQHAAMIGTNAMATRAAPDAALHPLNDPLVASVVTPDDGDHRRHHGTTR